LPPFSTAEQTADDRLWIVQSVDTSGNVLLHMTEVSGPWPGGGSAAGSIYATATTNGSQVTITALHNAGDILDAHYEFNVSPDGNSIDGYQIYTDPTGPYPDLVGQPDEHYMLSRKPDLFVM